MSTTYNVTIKKHNGTDWDVIHPKTTAENIISGTLSADRLPTIPSSKLSNDIPVTKLTLGPGAEQIDASLLPAIAITDVQTSTTMATFLMLYKTDPSVMQEGDVLILTTDKKTYIHNGGTKGTAADFTLLETPTDVVTSVAGKTGVVTLTKGDVGLSDVPNVNATNPANIRENPSYRFVTDSEKSIWSGKVSTLGDLGVTVAASKINFLSGVTQDVQTSLNEKQTKIILTEDALLGGYANPQSGDVAFTY